MDRHPQIATVIEATVFVILTQHDGLDSAIKEGALLLLGWVSILRYRRFPYPHLPKKL